MKEKTTLNKSYKKAHLLKYSFPSVIMMFTISVYVIIDGFFISNYISETAFAAVNLVFPVLMIIASFGLMIGTGSSAIIANKLGENKNNTANKYFSMFVYFIIFTSIILSILCVFIIRPVCILLGAQDELLEIASYYGTVSLISMTGYILQMAFLMYFNTAGKPNMGLVNAIIAGSTVLILDSLLVAVFKMGIDGILIATITSELLSGFFPICYFSSKKSKGLLHLISPLKAFKNEKPSNLYLIGKATVNGSSQAIQEIAICLVELLVLYQLNRFYGQDGLITYGIIDYAWIIFNAFYLGFSMSVAPLMSYQQGAQNKAQMKTLFKNCLTIIIVASITSFALSEIFAYLFSGIFITDNLPLLEDSTHSVRVYAITILFAGISTYGASLFTSLGKGVIAAIISFIRTIIFEASALIIIPEVFGPEGIWWSISCAEILAASLTVIFLIAKLKNFFK